MQNCFCRTHKIGIFNAQSRNKPNKIKAQPPQPPKHLIKLKTTIYIINSICGVSQCMCSRQKNNISEITDQESSLQSQWFPSSRSASGFGGIFFSHRTPPSPLPPPTTHLTSPSWVRQQKRRDLAGLTKTSPQLCTHILKEATRRTSLDRRSAVPSPNYCYRANFFVLDNTTTTQCGYSRNPSLY